MARWARSKAAASNKKQQETDDDKLAKYGSLEGKRVFVTGGGSGIGEAIVAAFAAQGAVVAFVDIARESEALCARWPMPGTGAAVPPLRHHRHPGAAAARWPNWRTTGRLRRPGQQRRQRPAPRRSKRSRSTTERAHRDQPAPDVLHLPGGAGRHEAPGGGSIINFSSMSWHAKNAGYPVYATTKAAVIGLTRGLARDLGPHNIRVNTVTPGWVMTQRQIDLWVDDAAKPRSSAAQCLPGKLMPDDVAAMVLFLAADDSAMCTAQDFVVDAGWI
jgi:NAD(P)-dependent dehydrogenase (short-subunit alcohol dehydrogenase family)